MKTIRLATLIVAIGGTLAGCYSYEWTDTITSSVAGDDASSANPLRLQLGAGVELFVRVRAQYSSVRCVGGLIIPGDFKHSEGNIPSNVMELGVRTRGTPVAIDFDKLMLTYGGERYKVQDVRPAWGNQDVPRRVVVPANTESALFVLEFPRVIDVRDTFTLALDGLATTDGSPISIQSLTFSPKKTTRHMNYGERGC